MTIESQPVSSPHSSETIYSQVSDLTHIDALRPLLKDKQIELQSIDADHCQAEVHVMNFTASLDLSVSERVPSQRVVYQIAHEMLPAEVTLTLRPLETSLTEIKVAMEAKVNPFMAGMIRPHLEQAVQQIAEALGRINYSEYGQ